jgi:hypothetical protein
MKKIFFIAALTVTDYFNLALAQGTGNLIHTHTLSPGCYSIKVQNATPMRFCIAR